MRCSVPVPCAAPPTPGPRPTLARASPSARVTRRRSARPAATSGLPLLPGVATGSEIMMCQEDGLSELKFFPAMQAGGAAMLKAWGGPFSDVKFCPTGGVTMTNAAELLALPNVVCVGGSWLVPAEALATGDWMRITQLAQAAAGLPRSSR